MGEGSSGPGPVGPTDAHDGETTQPIAGRATASRPPFSLSPPQAAPPHQPTQAEPPHQPTQAEPPHQPTQAASPYLWPNTGPPRPPTGVMRYGPGVPPAAPPGPVAVGVWRSGATATPARRPRRLRWLLGSALTVILLAASGVVLYLRFHHAPFHVTGVAIIQQTRTACGVNVTGRISTNGAAGTVSYQWVVTPGRQLPQPQNWSVIAGQHAAYVTAALGGSRGAKTSETVTLQVLGPDLKTTSTTVVVGC